MHVCTALEWLLDHIQLLGDRLQLHNLFQGVGCKGHVAGNMVICNVCASFGEGTEVWRAVSPAHWKAEEYADEVVTRIVGRQNDGEFKGSLWGQRDPIITISEIDLGEKGQTKGRVGIYETLQKTLECVANLHGMSGGQGKAVLIDTREVVVHNGVWPIFLLRDNAGWGQF